MAWWQPRDWEYMGMAERVFRGITLVLAVTFVLYLFETDDLTGGSGASSVTWWLLAAAFASQLVAALLSRRRGTAARFWIEVGFDALATAVFLAVAVSRGGA